MRDRQGAPPGDVDHREGTDSVALPGAPASGAPLGADLRCRTAGASWLRIGREGPNALAVTLPREGGAFVPPLSTAFSPRNQRLPHLTRSSAVPRPHGARETRCKCDQGVKGFLRAVPGRRRACPGQLPRLPTACLGSMPAYPGQHARIPWQRPRHAGPIPEFVTPGARSCDEHHEN